MLTKKPAEERGEKIQILTRKKIYKEQKEMGPPTDVFEGMAEGFLVVLYLALAAAEGGPRILRVIDSRRRIIVQRSAAYFAHVAYAAPQAAASSSVGGGGGGPNMSGNLNMSGGQQQQHLTRGGSATSSGQLPSPSNSSHLNLGSGRRTPRRYSSNVAPPQQNLPPLLSDNRFLLGVCALAAGILRSSFGLCVLLFWDNSPHSASITESNAVTDSITMPLAWLTYCLAISVLFCHRDLMAKLQQATAVRAPSDIGGGLGGIVTTGGLSSEQQQQRPASSTSNLSTGNDNNNVARDSGSALANDNFSNNTENDNNNNNILDQLTCGCTCCTDLSSFVTKYRAVFAMIFVGMLLVAGQVLEDEKFLTGELGEYVSSGISYVLFVLSLVSFVEALMKLRNFGRMSQRVIVAIGVLMVYCVVRGTVVIGPVQGQMCHKGPGSYWRCAWTFSAIDAIGLLLSSLILP